VLIQGQTQEKDRSLPDAAMNIVGPDYFKTMGMPILQGRAFTVNDKEGAPLVAVINETMAAKFWPGMEPLGRRFQIGEEKDKTYEIVGVTRTVKFMLPAESPMPGFYVPTAQRHRSDQALHIHTAGNPAGLVSAVREVLRSLDPDMPVWDVRTLEAHVLRGKMRLFNLGTAVMSAFGVIGVILAAVGLYGVMSFVVGQRTQEFGVRMALGATQEKVLRMILWQALRKAILGAVLGCVAAYGVTRLMANFLVGVSPTDALTFSAVTAFLLSVAAASALAPAWRATRVDPLAALRYE
jgi:predicted permease